MTTRVSLSDKINLNLIILAYDRLSATAKAVAGWLLFYRHNTATGLCNPSNRTIGIAIGIRPENVSRYIRSLVKYGYLIARRRFGTSNSYDFNWSRGSKAEVRALRTQLKRACATERDMTKSTIPVDEIVNTSCSKRQDDHDENVNLILEEKTRIEDGNLTLPGEIDSPLLCHLDEV